MRRVGRVSGGGAREGLGETFLVNDRVNQLLLEHLDQRAWRAKPQGQNVRTIAAIFTHMHNVRRKWVRLSAPHLKLPAELDRMRCTQKQASVALKESAQRCAELLDEALTGKDSLGNEGRVTKFVRDGWARAWEVGAGRESCAAAMLTYMVSHEAHHRGQVCMLAHQMGFRLPTRATSEMWAWERLFRRRAECGL